MEGSHHVNSNSIIYRKRAIHKTEIEMPFLAVKGFNTNLVQFLPLYHVIISNVHVYSFSCTKNYIIYEGLMCCQDFNFTPIKTFEMIGQ